VDGRRGRDGAPRDRVRRALPTLIALALTAIPPLIVVATIRATAVDVPYWDAWDFAPTIADSAEGRLRAGSLWMQHNEHRLVVPRIVMLGLAWASAWDVRWEQAASVVVALVQLVLIGLLVRRTVTPVTPRAAPWLMPAASALIFTLAAWQNWASGWQLCIFLCVAAATGAALVLARWHGRWPETVALQLLAVTAALSFASGLVVLPLVPLALLASPAPVQRRTRSAHAAASAIVGALLVVAYAAGFVRPLHHPHPALSAAMPLEAAWYVLTYLGAVFSGRDPTVAGVVGGAGLLATTLATVALWRTGTTLRAAVLPWVFLEAYALAGAAVTAIGRVGFGAVQALESRYVTLAAPFWIGAAATLTLTVGVWLRTRVPSPTRTLRLGFACGLVAGALAVGGWLSARAGAADLHAHAARMRSARRCLRYFAEAPDACFVHIHWSPHDLRRVAARLATLELGPFARWREPAPLTSYRRLPPTAAPIGRIESVSWRGDDVDVRGWAVDPASGGHARRVLVTQQGRVLGRAWTGLPRDADGAPHATKAGWHLRVPAFRLAPDVALDAWVVLDGSRLAPLAPYPPGPDPLRRYPLLRRYPTEPPGGDA